MNNLKKVIDIEPMIYEVLGKQVMSDSEIVVTKCHKSIVSCKIRNTIKFY